MSGIEGRWRHADEGNGPKGALPQAAEISRKGDSDYLLVMHYGDGKRPSNVMLFQTGDGGWARVGKYRLFVTSDGRDRLLMEAKRDRILRRAEVITASYARAED